MAEIKWTKEALRDLHEHYIYISIDSEFYAKRFADRIVAHVESLIEFPLMGRMVPEKEDKSIRELIEGNYRIFYRIGREKIFILRIHHAARRIK